MIQACCLWDHIYCISTDRDPCESFPCENNGTCGRVGFTDDFTCDCVPGFNGILCEIGNTTKLINGTSVSIIKFK